MPAVLSARYPPAFRLSLAARLRRELPLRGSCRLEAHDWKGRRRACRAKEARDSHRARSIEMRESCRELWM